MTDRLISNSRIRLRMADSKLTRELSQDAPAVDLRIYVMLPIFSADIQSVLMNLH